MYITLLEILKNVLEFIRGIIAQLYERNPKDDENKFNKNEKLLNDKFNGPDQYYNGNSLIYYNFKDNIYCPIDSYTVYYYNII